MSASASPLRPVLATAAGIAMLSLMDAFMKNAALAMGAYMAALMRAGIAFAVVAPVWLALRSKWPARAVMKIHLMRGAVGSITLSALLYAWNLVLQRQQALVAKPLEVATFYMGIAGCIYLLAAPFLFRLPPTEALGDVTAGALLTVGGALTMAWAYARAEAQVLVPLEYSSFIWASLFGWLMLGENVTWTAAGGAVLIVAGCWIATTGVRPEPAAV